MSHYWLVDPRDRTLEAFMLKSGIWVRIGGFIGNDKVRAEPFSEVEFDLGSFWTEDSPQSLSNPEADD